jgi:hypothetical protein
VLPGRLLTGPSEEEEEEDEEEEEEDDDDDDDDTIKPGLWLIIKSP